MLPLTAVYPLPVHWPFGVETGSLLHRMALWDCVGDEFWPSLQRQYVIANNRRDSVPKNSPIVQLDNTPTQSPGQPPYG